MSKKSESWQRGQSVEFEFGKILKLRNIPFRQATKYEQIFNHIDYVTDRGTIDVKAMKNLNRSDNNPQLQFVWLEFKNVNGDPGWLCSNVDYIAFEQIKSFLVVRRCSLLKLAKKLCNLNNLTREGGLKALYRGYQRQGRRDLISMIKLNDVLSLRHKALPKIFI